MLPKFDLQIMKKFDLQILTKFAYTDMSARCMRERPCSLYERALAAKMTKFWLFPLGTAKSQ